MFLGLGVAAGENSRQTRAFIERQPKPLWMLGVAKLLVGAVAVVLPGVLAAVLLGLVSALSEYFSWNLIRSPFRNRPIAIVDIGLCACMYSGTALSLYLWTAAIAANARDEIRAAMWSVGLLATYGVAAGVFASAGWFPSPALKVIASLGPLGWATQKPQFLAISMLAHIVVAFVFVSRFATPSIAAVENYSPQPLTSRNRHWLATPFTHPWQALAWKTTREAAPLVLCGAVGAVLMTVLTSLVELSTGHFTSELPDIEYFAFRLAVCVAMFGFFVAIVCGISVAWNDVQPGVNSFWRSRPCSPDQLFWIKYLGSLLIVVLAFGVPFLWATLVVESTLRPGEMRALLQGSVAGLLGFSIAVLATSLLQNAVYASILAIGGALAAFSFGVNLPLDNVYVWLPPLVTLVVAMLFSIASWLAFRYGWSLSATHA
jgi:hypothetical protein